MLPALLQRIEMSARRFLPLVTAALFVLGGVVAWPLPYIGAVTPELGLVALYYWTIHRPDLFRVPTVFFLGLLHDAIHFLPLGLSAFVFVGLHQFVLSQRRFFVRQSFVTLWVGFALLVALAMLSFGIILSVVSGHGISFLPVALQGLLTIVLFPFPAWLLIHLQRAFLSQS